MGMCGYSNIKQIKTSIKSQLFICTSYMPVPIIGRDCAVTSKSGNEEVQASSLLLKLPTITQEKSGSQFTSWSPS